MRAIQVNEFFDTLIAQNYTYQAYSIQFICGDLLIADTQTIYLLIEDAQICQITLLRWSFYLTEMCISKATDMVKYLLIS